MAEFKEVMRQCKRMCRYYPACKGCPLCNMHAGCTCSRCMRDYPDEVERIILDWAAEHPEARYPTWAQWWTDTFPDGEERAVRCNFTRCPKPGDPEYCQECMDSPIPADIAKKLGVKPITKEE